ncbi:acyl carrier protein [Acetivibrio cellulolyticus]|uniref:acyl carrier protein n=1 Tax=Acetivibrio cellulolyticus TaxID=35830 RepID=UPI0001E2FAEB|nr:acyl carrier protein [Acetivibrio cellulolyticus]
MQKNAESKLISILNEKFDVDYNSGIRLEDTLSSLNINSISFIRLVVEIEKEFNIEFQDDIIDVNNFKTLKSLVEFIEEMGG